ncbi:N-acetylmuramoyl-L-alanine amidase [Pseudomonas sp. L-22-4S-12]|uniref:N-acetylmuramoyl-L-alanine amidase n=1 Tax=Pseudomonas sp. L-22-4S-12 TaxID=2610893 RepID=UPI00132ADF37|nr:N-acetylmuramoyl-L-alanine amidase [Pseudomonas sp. L-22-4S-12]MWV14914.1 N-acetylmuramoyl-L-alanine amidase [Pseudomonas sp. L-22-4S-12]
MRLVFLALTALLLAACSSGPSINDSFSARSQSSRVQYIVLHYTSTDLAHSLALLTEGEVSSHYLIDANPPTIYRLVDEDRRAWHAGDSAWQGRTWLNASTLGIELVNQGYAEGPNGRAWQPYSEAQIDALIALLKDLVQRHQLPPDSIIGHSDIAPQRKVDPGPLFPWRRLAEAGLIRWPDAAAVAREQARFATALPDAAWFQVQLQQLGFVTPQSGVLDEATRNVLAALQMKYRPARYDGEPDAETAAILQVLNQPGG